MVEGRESHEVDAGQGRHASSVGMGVSMREDAARHHEHELSRDRQEQRESAARRIAEGERPWDEEQGVQSVVDAVRDVEFPANRAAIAEQAGMREVHPSSRLTLPISDILDKLPDRRFESIRDFQTSLQKHWQGIRAKGGFPPTQREAWPGGGGREAQGTSHAEDREGR